MPVPSMVDVSELTGFPGADQFTQEMVDVAVAAIRADAGWHIAPVATETVSVYSSGGDLLFLPSLRVLSVASVVINSIVVDGWRLDGGGLLYRSACWPVGLAAVTLTHGYEYAPDLIPAVAARLDGFTRGDRVVASRSTTDGPFTDAETYSTDSASSSASDPVARYRIPVVG